MTKMKYDIYKLNEAKETKITLSELNQIFNSFEIKQLKNGEILTANGSEYWMEEAMNY